MTARSLTAWDLVSDPDLTGCTFRVKGGRVEWEDAYFDSSNERMSRVRLSRLIPIMQDGKPRIRTATRYVAPETEVELVP